MVAAPRIDGLWRPEALTFRVSVKFPDGTEPQKSELWWNLNRSETYTLPFEYDVWTADPLSRDESGVYRGNLLSQSRPRDSTTFRCILILRTTFR